MTEFHRRRLAPAGHHLAVQPQGVRLAWDEVPQPVRDQVAAALGSPVVRAIGEPGGFSPGLAARCRLEDDRRYFIKAVSADQNPESPCMHRAEGRVTAALPPGLPAPRLVRVLDDGRWVVLVFEEVDGRPPPLPWSLESLAATFSALDDLALAATPCPVEGLLSFADSHAVAFGGYRRLAAGDRAVDAVDDWSRRHLDALADLEGEWQPAADGCSLLHSDIRADNLLIRSDGSVMLVDWPHACVGAAWVDKACMLPSVGLDGGPSPIEVEDTLDPFAAVDPDALNRVLVGLTGYFTFGAAQPDPPGLPTLRAFQMAQGQVARSWLADRLGLDR